MSKAFWILLLLISFMFGMITEAYLDMPEAPKPVIQKQWEPPKTPFQGLERVSWKR